MMEQLVNGAGYTSYIADSNGSGLPVNEQIDILCNKILDKGNPESIISFLNKKSHKDNCECSCYDCLRDYYNQRQHGSINWRLGLDLAGIAAKNLTPSYVGDDNYWTDLIKNRIGAMKKVEELKKDNKKLIQEDFHDDCIVIKYGNDSYLLYHPLWSNNKIQTLSKKYELEKAVDIIDYIQTIQVSSYINPFEEQKEDNVVKPASTQSVQSVQSFEFKITDEGANLKEYSNSKIWSDEQLGSCSNNFEKKLRKSCIAIADELNRREKPLYRCGVKIGNDTDEEIECDLLWKKSHVAYFTAVNEDYYEIACKSDWTCFCGNDENLDAQIILDQLREAM